MLFLSLLVLIPCFWTHRIQATDLGSHVYNAWLAALIQHGEAPGLKIVPQTSNVLFDLILSSLFKLLGPVPAEHIAVSLAVLVFFWGSFALCSAAAERAAWEVIPLLAMASYGFVFNMGFFNMYLSVGLSLLGMAILWRGRRWDLSLLAPLIVLIGMSHFMGLAGFLVLGGYLLAMRWLPLRWQLSLTVLCIAVYFFARWYILHHFQVLPSAANIYWMAGADQLVLNNRAFKWVAIAVLALAGFAFALSVRRSGTVGLRRAVVWLQAYGVIAIAVVSAPGGIYHPKLQYMGYLQDRASLYAIVILCCLLVSAKMARWYMIPLVAVALAFFTLLYFHNRALDRIEAKVERVVQPLKPGTRVVATLFPSVGSRIQEEHLVDRACIGHCFSVGNYEPSSGQFRIRITSANRIAIDTSDVVTQMAKGIYRVRPEDLPLTEIYSCGLKLDDICLQELKAGEYNGQAAYDQLAAFVNRQKN